MKPRFALLLLVTLLACSASACATDDGNQGADAAAGSSGTGASGGTGGSAGANGCPYAEPYASPHGQSCASVGACCAYVGDPSCIVCRCAELDGGSSWTCSIDPGCCKDAG